MRKSIFIILALISTCACSYTGEWAKVKQIEKNIIQPVFRQADYVITDYGAVGDGKTDDAKSIQAAINDCEKNGGGKVYLPENHVFVSSEIELKSNVEFNICTSATLKAIEDESKYQNSAFGENRAEGMKWI